MRGWLEEQSADVRMMETSADVRTVVEKAEETSVEVRTAVEKAEGASSAVGLGGGGFGGREAGEGGGLGGGWRVREVRK